MPTLINTATYKTALSTDCTVLFDIIPDKSDHRQVIYMSRGELSL